MTHLGLGPERGTLTVVGEPPPAAPWSAERVAAPRHTSQLVRLVQNARRRGIPLRVVGRDGAHPGDVMTVDLSSWQHVDPPDRERLTVMVEPGASFRQILARTLPFGLVPKALPLDLDASLGGVLSGAGVGSASHRHGFLATQVAYAQIVLGTGEVVHTGPVTERDAFDCVLGGAGRFGVITTVELKLEPAPLEVATYPLGYADHRGLVRDMLRLGDEPRVLHLLAGRGSPRESSGCQPYRLDVTLAAAPAGVPDLPRGLTPASSPGPLRQGLDRLFESQHARAVPGAVSGTRWVALLPDTPALPLVLEHVLASMEASHVCSVTLLRRGAHDPTALAAPSTGRVLAVSGRARPNRTGDMSADDDRGALAEMQRRVYRAGGRLCPSGWLPRCDPAFWRAHYGPSYSRMLLLKRLFDPARILSSPAPLIGSRVRPPV